MEIWNVWKVSKYDLCYTVKPKKKRKIDVTIQIINLSFNDIMNKVLFN